MTNRFYVNIFLSLVALLSLWLLWHFVINFKAENPANPRTPDAFVHHISMTIMNNQGMPAYQFSSPVMQHYAEKNRTVFDFPKLSIIENGALPWQVSAEKGEALEGDQTIHLFKHVFLTQPKSLHHSETHLQTEQIFIDPKKQLIFTPDSITGVQPNLVLNSKGMKADIHHKTLDLFSQVHVIYKPLKKPLISIVSHKAHFDQFEHKGAFEGDVILKQNNHILFTPLLIFYIDKNNTLFKAVAKGKNKLTRFQTQTDNPTSKNTAFSGTADEIQYLPKKNIIRLAGHAKAQQGPNHYQAPEIVYDIQTEKVISQQGRMTLIILPKSLKKSV